MCGFNNLEREERLERAHEILNSNELKQAICNQILGTTFKDIEKAMEAVINERRLTPEQEEELEIKRSMPQKFDPDIEFRVNKRAATYKKTSGYREYTREEVAELIAASEAPFDPPPAPPPPTNYRTYTREEVQQLVREHDEYLQEEQRRKEERAKWDSLKTTEFDIKTENTKKRSTSTKA